MTAIADHPAAKLSSNPRTIEVVCVKDGYTYNFKDDGGAPTRDGFQPHPFRSQLERKMRQGLLTVQSMNLILDAVTPELLEDRGP